MTTRRAFFIARASFIAKAGFASLLMWGIVALPGLQAQSKSKTTEPYALIRGTVFQDSGFSQSGVKVVLSIKGGKKLQEQTSSPRGEYAFRVPTGPGEYVLTATLKGFEPVEAAVKIEAQEQVNQNLSLPPASKKKQ